MGSRVPRLAKHQPLPRLSSNKGAVLGPHPVFKNVGWMGLSVNPVVLCTDSAILTKSLVYWKLQVLSCKMEAGYAHHGYCCENPTRYMLCDRISLMPGT